MSDDTKTAKIVPLRTGLVAGHSIVAGVQVELPIDAIKAMDQKDYVRTHEEADAEFKKRKSNKAMKPAKTR